MCEYCEKGGNSIYYKNNEKNVVDVQIVKNKKGQYSLRLQSMIRVSRDSFRGQFERYVRINYCPMCGRDLRGDAQ